MQLIPIALGLDYMLIVILEPENLERMIDNDPAKIELQKLPPFWSQLRLRDILIVTPSPEDLAIARQHLAEGSAAKALNHLTRGYSVKPEDHDRPYA